VTKPEPIIVCAAIKNKTTGVIICGARHYDPLMRHIISLMPDSQDWISTEQGFIDQYGVFHSREDAHMIARRAGQIKADKRDKLFSEDLY